MPTGWVVNVCIWTIAVGQSGCNKTGAHDFVRDVADDVFDDLVKSEVHISLFFSVIVDIRITDAVLLLLLLLMLWLLLLVPVGAGQTRSGGKRLSPIDK